MTHQHANAVPCDCCGRRVGSLWYQLRVEEWHYPECTSTQEYVICETCFPQLGQLIWRREAMQAFSDWVAAQSTTD